MGIEYFLQQLVNGICLGGMYALMSVGYSLVYSIMNFSNFAHGGVIMVGAYVGYFALTAMNVPFLPAFLLCGVGSGLLAVIIERLVYSPLRKRHAPVPVLHHLGDGRFHLPGKFRHRHHRRHPQKLPSDLR